MVSTFNWFYSSQKYYLTSPNQHNLYQLNYCQWLNRVEIALQGNNCRLPVFKVYMFWFLLAIDMCQKVHFGPCIYNLTFVYLWLIYYIFQRSYFILLSCREKMAVLLYQMVRIVLLHSSDSLMNPLKPRVHLFYLKQFPC